VRQFLTTEEHRPVLLKVGLLGNSHVGKVEFSQPILFADSVQTTLLNNYVSEDAPSGAVFMEKRITIKGNEVTLSIWDLPGGDSAYTRSSYRSLSRLIVLNADKSHPSVHHMLSPVCTGATALFFIFDLTNMESLLAVKEWYRAARGVNKATVPFLVGNKYDLFVKQRKEDQEKATTKVRRLLLLHSDEIDACDEGKEVR
jgi:GTPase SAR1 family protein